jgi:predicted methyltransferase
MFARKPAMSAKPKNTPRYSACHASGTPIDQQDAKFRGDLILVGLTTRYTVAALACFLFVWACASSSSRQSTAEALTVILTGDQRPPEERARDVYRHPKETLLFFGIRPEMKVMEVWPEPGWYTAVIAPLLREKGKYYAAVIAADPSSKYITHRLEEYRSRLAARPEVYDRVTVVTFPADGSDAVPAGSVDMVVTFRNIHNWMARDQAVQAFATMYRALKPGGVLGVVEHRGNPAVPQDPKAKSGYVNEDYAIKLIEQQGFRLVAKSEVNDNPRDTKDYEQGVWTLPPTYRLGAKDHDKYAAIGESDRFTLRFLKPAR